MGFDDDTNDLISVSSEPEQAIQCRIYRRRWFMLFIFVCFSFGNALHWIQYSIIADIIVKYYNVSSLAVDWTSLIFMVTFIPLIIPAMHFLDEKGLRWSIILGTFGTAAGACVKVASVKPNLFWVTFIGQTLVAVSQVFMFSVPPSLAAVWFGADQVSTACSIGIFGNLLGVAVGFIVSPMIVRNHDNIEDIGSELLMLFYSTAGFSTAVFLMTVAFFQDKPPMPPSVQQAMQRENASRNEVGFWNLIKRLLHNRGYMLLLFAFAINQACFSAFSTLLNQTILEYFKDGEEFAGRLGLIAIIAGMAGGILFGILQDKTHKYKQITLAVYSMSFVGMVAVTSTLQTQSELFVYIASSILGCFSAGYMPIAFDFGAELTYPEPEGMTAGILAMPSQIFSALITLGYNAVFKSVGVTWANITLCILLLIGVLLHIAIRSDLRRQSVTTNLANHLIP